MKNKNFNIFKSDGFKKLFASVTVILIGLFFGFIIMLISNPQNSGQGLLKLLTGNFSSHRPVRHLGNILFESTPLIFTGLSIGVAYKVGLFNIGASGQFTMGILGAFFAIDKFVPESVFTSSTFSFQYWLLIVAFALLFAGVTGAIIGSLKAYFNVNEVISGILINYIAMHSLNHFATFSQRLKDPASGQTVNLPTSLTTPKTALFNFFGSSFINMSFLIAIILAVILLLFFKYAKYGKELQMVGKNKHSARYAGISQNKATVVSITLASLLAGLGGVLYLLSDNTLGSSIPYSIQAVILPHGFDGIVVALIGFTNPIGIIFSSIFINYISVAGVALQTSGYQKEIVSMIIGIILYLVSFSLFIFQINFNKIFKKKIKEVSLNSDYYEVDKKILKEKKKEFNSNLKLINTNFKVAKITSEEKIEQVNLNKANYNLAQRNYQLTIDYYNYKLFVAKENYKLKQKRLKGKMLFDISKLTGNDKINALNDEYDTEVDKLINEAILFKTAREKEIRAINYNNAKIKKNKSKKAKYFYQNNSSNMFFDSISTNTLIDEIKQFENETNSKILLLKNNRDQNLKSLNNTSKELSKSDEVKRQIIYIKNKYNEDLFSLKNDYKKLIENKNELLKEEVLENV